MSMLLVARGSRGKLWFCAPQPLSMMQSSQTAARCLAIWPAPERPRSIRLILLVCPLLAWFPWWPEPRRAHAGLRSSQTAPRCWPGCASKTANSRKGRCEKTANSRKPYWHAHGSRLSMISEGPRLLLQRPLASYFPRPPRKLPHGVALVSWISEQVNTSAW